LRIFRFGGYGLALAALVLAALALGVFGAIECPPKLVEICVTEPLTTTA